MIILLDKNTAYNNNLTHAPYPSGIGMITPLSHSLVKELSGVHEGQFTLDVNDIHFNDIQVGSILLINTNHDQLGHDEVDIYKVYNITKPINFISTIKYRHVTYDLNKMVVPYFDNTDLNTAKNIINNAIYPFTFNPQFTSLTQINNDRPRTFMEWLANREGSFIDTYKCSFFTSGTYVVCRRNEDEVDSNLKIEYGSNMTEFNCEINGENTFTSVRAYANKDGVYYMGDRVDKTSFVYPLVKLIDTSDKYSDTTPTVASLTQDAQDYANNNPIETPSINVTLSYINNELNGQNFWNYLIVGDKVSVYFTKYGFSSKAHVIKTEYNPELRRFIKVEIGDHKPTLYSTIRKIKE